MVRRLWIFFILLVLVIFSTGCSRDSQEAAKESDTYALSISVDGQGTITPPEGVYDYEEDTYASLKASPDEGWYFKEWVGPVLDPFSEETTIHMDKDQEVTAVFLSVIDTKAPDDPPPPPESQAAQSSWEMTGEGFRARADGWNCSGLQGEWTWIYTLDVAEYGTIQGNATYIVPPPPENGPWLTEPFSYTISGILDFEDAEAEITYIFEDVVVEIIALEDGPVLLDNVEGMVKGIVKVVTPDITFVVSETVTPMDSDVPGVVVFEPHPECE